MSSSWEQESGTSNEIEYTFIAHRTKIRVLHVRVSYDAVEVCHLLLYGCLYEYMVLLSAGASRHSWRPKQRAS